MLEVKGFLLRLGQASPYQALQGAKLGRVERQGSELRGATKSSGIVSFG
jgi:hypothetical protein